MTDADQPDDQDTFMDALVGAMSGPGMPEVNSVALETDRGIEVMYEDGGILQIPASLLPKRL
ncbi:hypothetical protein [Streptomyces sp. cg35]|uniref:hypothetical protein n=1 Tax=Streptomyces sp. cg35 TaxID=3421650 RepID=UPI003D173824